MLKADGTCYRALEYCVRNDTSEPIERIYGGDTSDKDFTFDEIDLKIHFPDGTPVAFEPTLDTPRFKRWDVILSNPLMPGNTIRYFSSWLSCDNHKMQTSHNRPADHGFIQYVFPKAFVDTDIRTALRNNVGWIENPAGVVIHDYDLARVVFYSYRDVSGVFQFRITW